MSLRDDIVANARWGAANEKDIHYTQAAGRMAAVGSPRSLPLYTDCSGFVTECYAWAGAPDPNGRNYNGTGWTGTLLEHLEHIQKDELQPADPVVFGPPPGDHVVIVVETGPDPLCVSHGQEAGPILIRLSVEAKAHRAPIFYLRGDGLDSTTEDDMAQVPQDEWAQVNMIVHALQADVTELKARALTPEQLDALVGPKDGLYAALNDRFKQIDTKLDEALADLAALKKG